jgi:hypothetical protein
MSALLKWASNVAYALDCLANALTGGDPKMPLSARMGRDIALGLCKACRAVCWVLSLIQRDHCAKSWANAQRGADGSGQITGD